jgi:branched-chain amino acid transport system substrate-binding protein
VTGPIAFDDKGALKAGSSTVYQVKNGAWVPLSTEH